MLIYFSAMDKEKVLRVLRAIVRVIEFIVTFFAGNASASIFNVF